MMLEVAGAAGALEGALVEIRGVGGPLEPYPAEPALALAGPAVDVDGFVGRCVGWNEFFGKYFVQLFDGRYFLVPGECLALSEPDAAELGGFDVAWPSPLPGEPLDVVQLSLLAQDILDVLDQKGWCLVQLIADDALREQAAWEALSLPDLAVPKAELAADLLGRGTHGRMAVLEQGGGEAEESWALSEFDRQLTHLARSFAQLSVEALGVRCRGRRKGVVQAPFADAAQAAAAGRERLSDADVRAGAVEAHLEFIRSRRLCLSTWIDNDGGECVLYPMPLGGADELIRLPLSAGKLLVYRCDWLLHGYFPAGRGAFSLTTWILDDELDKQRLMGGHIVGEVVDKSEALGIFAGPPMPVGYRTHIMAMHAHSPCNVHDLEEFSMIFQTGADGYIHIPLDRFDTDIYCTEMGHERHPFKSYVVHSAMIDTDEMVMFDNNFFGISNAEATCVAPGQRMVLQDGYLTLHRAGFSKSSLRGRNMGAYCGDTGSEFSCWGQLSTPPDAPKFNMMLGSTQEKPYGKVVASEFSQSGVMSIITANRLSHALGLIGGASSVDTACSASLVGVAVAVQNFRKTDGAQLRPCADKGHEDALCVGISCLVTPMAFIALCGPSMLAPGGRCFTFDVGASGYARGDGFAGAYLKPSSSEEDNAKQIACLMGCAVNQDGRSATLTAPNGNAQQACIRESMREAGVVANQITIAECHGTGTALGDPIEVGALRGVMEPRGSPLLATSAKSNIGHLECCAGLTGLMKCCLMVSNSAGAPNLHLHTLNPHLDVDGFPAYFLTEATDTGLNSNFAGVSSFGFSGTNARADVWSACKVGPRKATKVESQSIQVHVQCPVTLGMMELLTGENVTPAFRARAARYRADVLRDEGAPYDVSRHAYEGGFRYRSIEDEDLYESDELDLDPFDQVFITGSWTAFTELEEMRRQSDGWYTACLVLGDGRFEQFRLCLSGDRSQELYPTVERASERIWIEGPDRAARGRAWCIDGRDREVPTGTVYEVRFKWHPERKSIRWTQSSTPALPWHQPSFRHCYGLSGSFSAGGSLEMRPAHDGAPGFEGRFRIGAAGEEEFQICRDGDRRQMLYPATARAFRTTVPVRGPDHLAGDKAWLVQGPAGDWVTVRLRIEDAHVTVTVASAAKGSKEFCSQEGMDRHEYSVVGSWTDSVPVAMVPDPDRGVYKAFGKIRGDAEASIGSGFAEAFQIVVDGDFSHAVYPQQDGAGSGESIVVGPTESSGADSEGRSWMVRSHVPHARFEICYDPHAVDRRKVVTWSWMSYAG